MYLSRTCRVFKSFRVSDSNHVYPSMYSDHHLSLKSDRFELHTQNHIYLFSSVFSMPLGKRCSLRQSVKEWFSGGGGGWVTYRGSIPYPDCHSTWVMCSESAFPKCNMNFNILPVSFIRISYPFVSRVSFCSKEAEIFFWRFEHSEQSCSNCSFYELSILHENSPPPDQIVFATRR